MKSRIYFGNALHNSVSLTKGFCLVPAGESAYTWKYRYFDSFSFGMLLYNVAEVQNSIYCSLFVGLAKIEQRQEIQDFINTPNFQLAENLLILSKDEFAMHFS